MLCRFWLRRLGFAAVIGALFGAAPSRAAGKIDEIRIDYAYYNPLSLILKDKGWLDEELKKDGIKLRWVLSLGSNKALEFLNAKSLDFGSTAGAAALLGRINGNPVKSIYVYSRPEWTALVTQAASSIHNVGDLKGKRVAATRGTDPYIFLIRALSANGLTEKDVRIVLLQHQDGRLALAKGDVDAWAGLDPMMAQAEREDGARLFFRNAAFNSWGVLNTRAEFATDHPDLVRKVLSVYEKARAFALAPPDEVTRTIATYTKLPDDIAAAQLRRTSLETAAIGEVQKKTIEEAGMALRQAGIIPADVNVEAATEELIDPTFVTELGIK